MQLLHEAFSMHYYFISSHLGERKKIEICLGATFSGEKSLRSSALFYLNLGPFKNKWTRSAQCSEGASSSSGKS
jgi:hypothetical protein